MAEKKTKSTQKGTSKKAEPVYKLKLPTEKSNIPKEIKENIEGMDKKITKFHNDIIEKFDEYIIGVSILPPKKDEKGAIDNSKVNLLVLVDDSDSKKMSKMELKEKLSVIIAGMAQETDKKLFTETIILSELWQSCYDQKTELASLIAASVPIYDKGVLDAVKISFIHRSMVVKKFEKYIVSYVVFGAVTKGRMGPDSDIDVAVVVDDTDVKKMTRAELKDKLRAIIISMGIEAKQITGVEREFHVQVYILTDFWDSIKEAHPVIFDLLRDGVPMYDRGIFMPWKQLLLMGKIKPSDEAIEMFMNSGEQIQQRVKHKLRDIAMDDLFLSILTPSQAALMTYGLPPPAPKEAAKVLEDVFVKKEKLLEQKYVDILAEVIKTRKDIEHGRLKEVSGKQVDDLLTKSEDYLKRIQKLFTEIDGRKNNEDVRKIYEQTITAVRDALIMEGVDEIETGKIEKVFKEKLVETGKLPETMIKALKDIIKGKKDYDADKLSKNDVAKIKKESRIFIKSIVEYMQRKRAKELEQTKIRIKHGESIAEIMLLDKKAFVIPNLEADEKQIQVAELAKDGSLTKIRETDFDELEQAIADFKGKDKIFLKPKTVSSLEKIFGNEFDILIK